MYGIYYIIPYITNNRKDEQMDTIDSIIINAQILALVQAKNKIQERIDELERQKEDKDEIQF